MMQTEILFEDKDILVCCKPAGIATQTGGFAAMDVVSELKNYLSAKGQADPFVGVIQRLDQPVEPDAARLVVDLVLVPLTLGDLDGDVELHGVSHSPRATARVRWS